MVVYFASIPSHWQCHPDWGNLMAAVLINLLVTVPAVIAFRRMASTRHGMNWIVGAALAFIVFLPCSMALLLQGAITLVLALIAWPFAPNNRLFKASLVIAPIFSYAAMIWMVQPELRERAELRREFPMVSLAERLKYEVERGSPATTLNASLELTDSVEKRLRDTEHRGLGNRRTHLLQSLHRATSDQFVLARGFGPIRMLSTHRYRIELPDFPPIPYETAPAHAAPRFNASGSALEATDGSGPAPGSVSRSLLTQMHVDSFDDFLDPLRMGYVEDLRHVAGFQPHRFYQMPGTEGVRWQQRFSDDAPQLPPDMSHHAAWRKGWAIIRLELIGTLSHPQPVAYVSDHLPQLDELSTYPTRELNEFEKAALSLLRATQDVVVDEQAGRILMVGSLRASDNCRRCHTVPRGELLGALTYEMRPE